MIPGIHYREKLNCGQNYEVCEEEGCKVQALSPNGFAAADDLNVNIECEENGKLKKWLAWPFDARYVHPISYFEIDIPEHMRLGKLLEANKYILGDP